MGGERGAGWAGARTGQRQEQRQRRGGRRRGIDGEGDERGAAAREKGPCHFPHVQSKAAATLPPRLPRVGVPGPGRAPPPLAPSPPNYCPPPPNLIIITGHESSLHHCASAPPCVPDARQSSSPPLHPLCALCMHACHLPERPCSLLFHVPVTAVRCVTGGKL